MPERPDGELVDMAAFRAMAEDCGWSAGEFVAFYDAGVRKELAALRSALDQNELDTVARLAHGARGSSASACVPGMAEAFGDLERAATEGDADGAAVALAATEALLDRVLTRMARAEGEGEP